MMKSAGIISIPETCNKLRQVGLQLSEICTLVNTLGDLMVKDEILESSTLVEHISQGLDQLVDILSQTTHPTVRYIAFQNLRYFLNEGIGIYNISTLTSHICNGFIRLISHWNIDVQIESLSILLEYEEKLETLANIKLFGIILNSNIEICHLIFSLLIQFQDSNFYFLLPSILESLKSGVSYIGSKEILMQIVDTICQLCRSNHPWHSLKYDSDLSITYKYTKLEYLPYIFDIFDQISFRFPTILSLCFNLIWDEIFEIINPDIAMKDFILSTEQIKICDYGFKISTNISLRCNVLLSTQVKNIVRFIKFTMNLFVTPSSETVINTLPSKCSLCILNSLLKSLISLSLKSPLMLIFSSFIDPTILESEKISTEDLGNFDFLSSQMVSLDQLFLTIESIYNFLHLNQECKEINLVFESLNNLMFLINTGILWPQFEDFDKAARINYTKLNTVKLLRDVTECSLSILSETWKSQDTQARKLCNCFLGFYLYSKIILIQIKLSKKSSVIESDPQSANLYQDEWFSERIHRFFIWVLVKLENVSILMINKHTLGFLLLAKDLGFLKIVEENLNIRFPNCVSFFTGILTRWYGRLVQFNIVDESKFLAFKYDLSRKPLPNLNSLVNLPLKIFVFVLRWFCGWTFKNTFRDEWFCLQIRKFINEQDFKHIIETKLQGSSMDIKYRFAKYLCIAGCFGLAKDIFGTIKVKSIELNLWILALKQTSNYFECLSKLKLYRNKAATKELLSLQNQVEQIRNSLSLLKYKDSYFINQIMDSWDYTLNLLLLISRNSDLENDNEEIQTMAISAWKSWKCLLNITSNICNTSNKVIAKYCYFLECIITHKGNIDNIKMNFAHLNKCNNFEVNQKGDIKLSKDISYSHIVDKIFLSDVYSLFPPMIFSLSKLPMVILNVDVSNCKNFSKSNTASITETSICPVIKICGTLVHVSQEFLLPKWKWVRLMITYTTETQESFVGTHFLEISVNRGTFSWVQPIELPEKVSKLTVTALPVSKTMANIGIASQKDVIL
ncbi:hypothetical protein ACR3K2_05170 [Cryptosporidium serpentis]